MFWILPLVWGQSRQGNIPAWDHSYTTCKMGSESICKAPSDPAAKCFIEKLVAVLLNVSCLFFPPSAVLQQEICALLNSVFELHLQRFTIIKTVFATSHDLRQ